MYIYMNTEQQLESTDIYAKYRKYKLKYKMLAQKLKNMNDKQSTHKNTNINSNINQNQYELKGGAKLNR